MATALSPIAPLGEARIAETSTGIAFDTLVLPLGGLAIVCVVLALGIWPALRAARTFDSGDSAVRSRPVSSGGSPGCDGRAAERGDRCADCPAAKDRQGLRSTRQHPSRYRAGSRGAVRDGGLWRQPFAPHGYAQVVRQRLPAQFHQPGRRRAGSGPRCRSLEHNKAVTGITEGIAIEISVDGVSVGGIAGTAVRGPMLLSTVAGHIPSGADQIGLGVTTMRQAGAHLGSVIRVTVSLPSGGTRTLPFRVVSQVSFPVLAGTVSLGSGAVLTIAGYEKAVCPPGPSASGVPTGGEGGWQRRWDPGQFRAGSTGEAAINHYLDGYRSITALAVTPTSLINFGEAVNFPLIFGAMLAVFGVATLAHLLVVSVSRRRREVGLLEGAGVRETPGCLGRDLASHDLGPHWDPNRRPTRESWLVVRYGGRSPTTSVLSQSSVVPLWLVCVMVVGVVVVANLIAIAPAMVATRSKPGDLLRSA